MSKSRHLLAAILFADIKGYSSLMEANEENAMRIINRYQKVIEQEVWNHEGEIIKSYGDGSIVLFNSTINAVECAKNMQIAFREDPVVPLRIGIHLGEVIDKGDDVFGNAINVASRIESMGVVGGVLISQNVYDKIKNHKAYSTERLGTYEFHNIDEALAVYALANDNLVVPDKNEVKGKAKKKRFLLVPSLIGALVVLGLLFSSSFIFRDFFFPKRVNVVEQKGVEGINKKSIAVLPFQNLSTDKENQYFTDGMHDDLLTYLSKSKLLKVISRSSVSRLKDTDRPVSEIADLLGVTHIMEGSVRRIRNQARINVQLVDALSDDNLWAENYDIELSTKNILDVQSDIAEKISNTLVQSVFSPGESSTPSEYTDNLDAYEYYLRARQLKESGNRASLYEAKQLLEEALRLDESFGQAYILLGNLHIHLVYYAGENPDIFFPEAERLMNKGLALVPYFSDGYALKGSLYHWWKKDFKASEQAYLKAIELNPNNDNALYGYAIAYQDLNMDFERVRALMNRALEINPLNPNLINTSALYDRESGALDKAINTFRKGIEIAPEHPNLWANYAGTYYYNSRLDSVAYICRRSVEENGKKGIHLRYFLESLSNIGALSLLENELALVEHSDRQDIVTKHNFSRDLYLQQRKFKEADDVTNLIAGYNMRWPDVSLYRFENAVYAKNYEKARRLYELDIDGDLFVQIEGMSSSKVVSCLNYAYALIKTGDRVKGEQIIERLLEKNINIRDDTQLRVVEKSLYDLAQSGIASIRGNYPLAIDLLKKYIDNGNLHNLRWIELDPMFEPILEIEEFSNWLDGKKRVVTGQRAAYLSKN